MARHYRGGNRTGIFVTLAILFVLSGALAFVLCRLYPQNFPTGAVALAERIATGSRNAVSDLLGEGKKAPTEPPAKSGGDIDIKTSVDIAEPAQDDGKPATSDDERPMLAIVIDDGGEQLDLTRQVVALDVPLTWAIIPSRKYTQKTAALADVKGVPYLLHLPMQAENDRDKSEYLVGEGMTNGEIRTTTSDCLDELPRAIGLSNHRGSLATANREVMVPVIDELKSRGLMFFDSRTTAKSVAYGAAKAAGIKTLKNNGFIDNTADKDAIAARFKEAVKRARKRGGTIVICHFRPATILFLKKLNEEYAGLPVRLVTLPEMFAGTITEDKERAAE